MEWADEISGGSLHLSMDAGISVSTLFEIPNKISIDGVCCESRSTESVTHAASSDVSATEFVTSAVEIVTRGD